MEDSNQVEVLSAIRQKILTCPLCNRRYGLQNQEQLPICLDCSHTFCFACLTHVRLGMGIFSTISCPTCNLETTAGVSGVSGLNRNETTISLINIMESHDLLSGSGGAHAKRMSSQSPTSFNYMQSILSPSGQSYVRNQQADMVENVVITVAQYRRLITDEKIKRIANRAGCQINLSIPHISLFSEPPPEVAIISFRGNQVQINDGKSLFRRYLRDFRPHSFTTNASRPSSSDYSVRELNSAASQHDSFYEEDSTSQGVRQRQTHSFTGRAVSHSPFPDGDEQEHNKGTREWCRMQINCDSDAVGNLLGAEGTRFKELTELTSCHLVINPLDHTRAHPENGDFSSDFNLELIGMRDKVSVAIPFIKMVIARGESAMRHVRDFYGTSNQQRLYNHKNLSFSQQSPAHMRYQHLIYQGENRRRNAGELLPGPPGLVRECQPLYVSSDKDDSSDSDSGRGGVSVFNPSDTPRQDWDKVKARRDCFRTAIPMLPKPVEEVNVIPDHKAEVEDLSEGSASCQFDSSQDHDDADDDAQSNKSPLPYTISPASSPTSKTFPNYFVQPRQNKNSEVMSLMRIDFDLLFDANGPTVLANSIMQESECEISKVHQPLSTSASETVKIVGKPINREKAKFLLGNVKKDAANRSLATVGGNLCDRLDQKCITRWMDCPAHFIPVLFGEGGYTIEDIQTRTSTRIIVDDHKDEDQPPQICIIGLTSSVEHALECIERLLVNHRFKYRQRPFSPSQRTRSLPSNPTSSPGNLLSPFSTPPTYVKSLSDSATDKNITGSPLPTKLITTQLTSSIPRNSANGESEGTENISSVSTQLLCPGDKVSQLIGKKGSILRELKKISKCEISIERVTMTGEGTADSNGTPPPQLVHVTGSNEDVKAAVHLIDDVIELGPVVALKMQTVKMVIPHDKVPLVIGQRGITAKEMMRRSGCKIHVNETVDADDNCFIELTGTTEQLSAAKELISQVLEHGTKALGKKFQKS